ncbi:MAG: DUF4266 domain-containing protein [Gammaproteobacteria bacterium]
MKVGLLVAMVMAVSACSHLQPEVVQPWERGNLARENMMLTPNPVQAGLDEHIYFSKEAASGGSGVGGGGCGCN